MSDKICPLMSGNAYSVDDGKLLFNAVHCQEGQCQFWITVYTTENDPVSGCCHALAPRMVEGLYRV